MSEEDSPRAVSRGAWGTDQDDPWWLSRPGGTNFLSDLCNGHATSECEVERRG